MASAVAVQQFTEKVLARPEFQVRPAPAAAPPGWLSRLSDWLAAHPLLLFGGLSLGELLALALAAAVVITLAVYVTRLLVSEQGRRPRVGRQERRDAREGPLPPADPRESIRAAGRALAEGDSRRAIQELLGACITFLSGRGLISSARWKTNLAYLRECPRDSGQYPILRDLTAAYEEIVYAHRRVSGPRMEGLASELSRQLEQP